MRANRAFIHFSQCLTPSDFAGIDGGNQSPLVAALRDAALLSGSNLDFNVWGRGNDFMTLDSFNREVFTAAVGTLSLALVEEGENSYSLTRGTAQTEQQ